MARASIEERTVISAQGRPELVDPIPFTQVVRELVEVCCAATARAQALKLGEITCREVRNFPPLTEEHRQNPRRYAQCIPGAGIFEFADQFRLLPWPYRLGLYAHEIGHVVDPDPRKTEDAADYWGGEVLDLTITYDHRWPGKGLQVAVPRR